jgi:hypothetical protein
MLILLAIHLQMGTVSNWRFLIGGILDKGKTLEHIKSFSGTHFNLNVVEYILDVIELGKIRLHRPKVGQLQSDLQSTVL